MESLRISGLGARGGPTAESLALQKRKAELLAKYGKWGRQIGGHRELMSVQQWDDLEWKRNKKEVAP